MAVAEVITVQVVACGQHWDLITINEHAALSLRVTTQSLSFTTNSQTEVPEKQTQDKQDWCKKCAMERCQCVLNGMTRLKIFKSPPRKTTGTHVCLKGDGLHFCVFLKELRNSYSYRNAVLQYWRQFVQEKSVAHSSPVKHGSLKDAVVKWRLLDLAPYIMDQEWGQRLRRLVWERQQLDTAMSWLSTLGGACSALGDYDPLFAHRASCISLNQLDIAQRLGDPTLASRCRLYAAIALIQGGKYQAATGMIRQEYRWALGLPEGQKDPRLINMCQGIWVKLRYDRQARRRRHHPPHSIHTV